MALKKKPFLFKKKYLNACLPYTFVSDCKHGNGSHGGGSSFLRQFVESSHAGTLSF
jgi:hypothetical protein